MKQEIFRGIATALATPMELDGASDYEAYGRLIDWQIDAGVAGLVACGTTGESATMTEAEHKEVIRFTVERAAGRVPVIAGTGSKGRGSHHADQQQGQHQCRTKAFAFCVVHRFLRFYRCFAGAICHSSQRFPRMVTLSVRFILSIPVGVQQSRSQVYGV